MAGREMEDSDTDVSEFSYHSSSSSDNEEQSFPSFDVKPYQFEPPAVPRSGERLKTGLEAPDNEPSRASDSLGTSRVGNTTWCRCIKCEPMTTEVECICCTEVNPAVERMQAVNKGGITLVEGFTVNCLNIDVLEASFYEYLSTEHGPLGEDEDIHRLYRHIAYRRFTRYIWKLLGRKNRKVIPACAVTAIRRAFPSEAFANFKYSRP